MIVFNENRALFSLFICIFLHQLEAKIQQTIPTPNYNHPLKMQFKNWVKSMKSLDVTEYTDYPYTQDEKADGMLCKLERCKMDKFIFKKENDEILLEFEAGSVCYDKMSITRLRTNSSTVGEGWTELTYTDDYRTQHNLKDGCINGLVKEYSAVNETLVEQIIYKELLKNEEELYSLLVFNNDLPMKSIHGWWFYNYGDALYCTPNKLGQADGDDCVYLYQDIYSGLVGRWKDGIMIVGHPALLQRFESTSGEMLKPVMKILDDRESYEFFQPTKEIATPHPMQTDLYEDIHVYVAPSTLPNAGEGLFAKTRFEAWDIISIFSGTRFLKGDKNPDMSTGGIYRVGSWDDHIIDIPLKYASTKDYVASLGHKTNHLGEKKNAMFKECYNPRFGDITCVVAVKSIHVDEEIFTDYGYEVDFSKCKKKENIPDVNKIFFPGSEVKAGDQCSTE